MALYKVFLTESFIEDMGIKLILEIFDACCSPDVAWKVIPMGGLGPRVPLRGIECPLNEVE